MPPSDPAHGVSVAPVGPTLEAAVLALRVHPAQSGFVGPIAGVLAETRLDPASEAMAILDAGTVVGFYRLDVSGVVIGGQALGQRGIALRSFMIDHRHQGRGFGRQALRACCDDLRHRHPERDLLALTVNLANTAALRLYKGSGFVDTGELYHGSPSGPQHILLRRLGPKTVGQWPP